jgi:hypothetical protein
MTPSIKPMRNMRALLGFLLKAEVDQIFKQQPFELPNGSSDPFDIWRASTEAVRRLSPTPTTPQISLLEDDKTIRAIKSRPTFARYYESVDDYQFALVPINALLAPQWVADFDYIEELSRQIEDVASLEDLLKFTMTEGQVTQPIVFGSQVIFNSIRADLHAEPIPFVREVAPGEFEIVVRAVSRPNYVQVAAIGGRYLLTNGVHRVCALQLRGHSSVPCVLRRVGRIEETGLNLQTTLFRPDLINGPRPAQVVDLLETRVASTLKMRSMNQVLRVGIGVDVIRVPAMSTAPIDSKNEASEKLQKSAPFLPGPADRPAASI